MKIRQTGRKAVWKCWLLSCPGQPWGPGLGWGSPLVLPPAASSENGPSTDQGVLGTSWVRAEHKPVCHCVPDLQQVRGVHESRNKPQGLMREVSLWDLLFRQGETFLSPHVSVREFELQHMLLVGAALTGRKRSFPQSYIIFLFDNISGPFKGPKVLGGTGEGRASATCFAS